MHLEDVDAFTAWLIKELKPICDAEPGVLAKYVLSLMRKPDKSDDEIREFCVTQLDVFLQGNTKRFVERMFAALKDGSYMEKKVVAKEERKSDEAKKASVPEKEAKKEEVTVKAEEPKATTSRDVKIDERNRRVVLVRKESPSRKEDPKLRRRISPPAADAKDAKKEVARDRDPARRRSRSPRNRRDRARRSPDQTRRHGRRSRSRSRSGEKEKRERGQGEERRKKRCRDYDELGYCTRGDLCHFDHGPDPVVVDRNVVDKIGPMAKGPNMSVPPPGYNPVNPPPPGVEAVFSGPTGTVEGYNPEAPAMTSPNFSVPPPPLPLHMNSAPWRTTQYSVAPVPMGVSVYDPAPSVPVDPSSAVSSAPRGGGTYRGRGRGAAMGGGPPRFGSTIRNGDGKTLLVRKIPVEQNTITKLNEHFAQFGNIVNIQVRYNDEPDSALITYTCRMEATNAIKSPSPVLNNRFIKVMWYNPDLDTKNTENAARLLSSGVSVNKPQETAPPPKLKVASVGEVKLFTNNYSAEIQLKKKRKELQEKSKVLLETQKKQTGLIDTLISQQKKIIATLREGEGNMDPENVKRLKSMAKDTSNSITSARESSDLVRKQLQETSAALKAIATQLDSSPKAETNGGAPPAVVGGKRTAATAGLNKNEPTIPNVKKRVGNALLVTGFTMDEEEKVTAAMEAKGELMDVEIQPGNGPAVSALYVYKDKSVAETVMEDGIEVNSKRLELSWGEQKSGSGQENTFQSAEE